MLDLIISGLYFCCTKLQDVSYSETSLAVTVGDWKRGSSHHTISMNQNHVRFDFLKHRLNRVEDQAYLCDNKTEQLRAFLAP